MLSYLITNTIIIIFIDVIVYTVYVTLTYMYTNQYNVCVSHKTHYLLLHVIQNYKDHITCTCIYQYIAIVRWKKLIL